MLQILTLPQWECRVPPPFARRSERYWTCAELPLDGTWTFLVNVAGVDSKSLPARSIVVVSVEKLLDLLCELGIEHVQSAYLLTRGSPDHEALEIDRLAAIEVGEDGEDGWRKVYVFHIQNGHVYASPTDFDAMRRMTGRAIVAKFGGSRMPVENTDHARSVSGQTPATEGESHA
jgi:hypothetical protein